MRELTKKQIAANRRLIKRLKPIRVSRLEKGVSDCDHCRLFKVTSLNNIYSDQDPIGNIVRWCDDCLSGCAGG